RGAQHGGQRHAHAVLLLGHRGGRARGHRPVHGGRSCPRCGRGVMTPTWDAVDKGTELPTQTFTFHRADLVRYAGASGDFNVIHWNERVATSVGLPNVIAHGMLTMATAARVITDWIGDPGAVEEWGVRFTRPIPVPD